MIGYEYLLSQIPLRMPPLARPAQVRPVTRVEHMPDLLAVPRHVAPGADASLLDHVLFALKHERTQLAILHEALKLVPADEMVQALTAQRLGAYLAPSMCSCVSAAHDRKVVLNPAGTISRLPCMESVQARASRARRWSFMRRRTAVSVMSEKAWPVRGAVKTGDCGPAGSRVARRRSAGLDNGILQKVPVVDRSTDRFQLAPSMSSSDHLIFRTSRGRAAVRIKNCRARLATPGIRLSSAKNSGISSAGNDACRSCCRIEAGDARRQSRWPFQRAGLIPSLKP